MEDGRQAGGSIEHFSARHKRMQQCIMQTMQERVQLANGSGCPALWWSGGQQQWAAVAVGSSRGPAEASGGRPGRATQRRSGGCGQNWAAGGEPGASRDEDAVPVTKGWMCALLRIQKEGQQVSCPRPSAA